MFGEQDSHLFNRYSFRHNHLMGPTTLLTVRLVSPHQRSPTDALLHPAASVFYLLPFIIGAEPLDQ